MNLKKVTIIRNTILQINVSVCGGELFRGVRWVSYEVEVGVVFVQFNHRSPIGFGYPVRTCMKTLLNSQYCVPWKK